jgi:4-carboxymuconolactone decarboxylase
MARIPYVEPDELDGEYRDLVISSLQPGKRINIHSANANNPPLLAGIRSYLGSVWDDSGLSERELELVILTATAETGVGYEWHQHVNIALDTGITADEIRAIAVGDQSPFTDAEAALLSYARAVVQGRVNDAHHDEITDYFDTETIVGAANAAVGYLALSRLIEAYDVEFEEGEEFVGWNLEAV